VLEDREERDEHSDTRKHTRLVAEQYEREHGERLRECRVERVQTTGRRPVHELDAVVDGVETPQERHLVCAPVTPVVADERDHDRERDCPARG
jgi:hypothetical protein